MRSDKNELGHHLFSRQTVDSLVGDLSNTLVDKIVVGSSWRITIAPCSHETYGILYVRLSSRAARPPGHSTPRHLKEVMGSNIGRNGGRRESRWGTVVRFARDISIDAYLCEPYDGVTTDKQEQLMV